MASTPRPFCDLEEGEVTFIDFFPDWLNDGEAYQSAENPDFRTLIDRANEWLHSNPQCEIKTCETVNFKASSDVTNYQRMVYLEHGQAFTYYTGILRLWVRKSRSWSAKQIGYANLIPLLKEEGGLFSSPIYETLDEMIARYNYSMRVDPLPGPILCIETSTVKSGANADALNWRESGMSKTNFVTFLRIFFQVSEVTYEEIGIQDFVPAQIHSSWINAWCAYEHFSAIMARASDWCARQSELRICNIQSVQTKLKEGIGGMEADPQRMSYAELGKAATFYLRIVRVAYIRISAYDYTGSSPPLVSCKTFVPVQLTRSRMSGIMVAGINMPEFETSQEAKQRVATWLKLAGAQVINMETTALRLNTSLGPEYSSGDTFTYNPRNINEYFIYVIRAYIYGTYQEPPQELLPPIPSIETKCCTII